MALLPKDVTDLYLAPVVLALDARIEELAGLELDQLATEVALTSNTADWTEELRATGLLNAIRYLVDMHEWTIAWDARGVRVGHEGHEVVLGVPETFRAYVAGTPARKARDLLH